MCQSFLKPFGKAFALLFLPYLSAFLLQSNHLLRIYLAALVAPTPSPPETQDPNSVAPTETSSRRKWRIISAISVLSILSIWQFNTVFQNFTPQAVAEASNAFNKYMIYASLFISVIGVTVHIAYPGKSVVHRTPNGKIVIVKEGGARSAAKQHPFLASLLILSIATFAFLMVRGLSESENSLSTAVVTMAYVTSAVAVGKVPLRRLVIVYGFCYMIFAITLFSVIKFVGIRNKLEEDGVWTTNLFKSLNFVTFLPAAIGTFCSGPLIASALRFDFSLFCVAQPTAKLSYEVVPHPSDQRMGKGIVVPQSLPFKFSKPYYTLALSTWSIIRITTLVVCLTTGFPFKSPYDACAVGILVELPIITIVLTLFAAMRGEARALWVYREAWVRPKAKASVVKKPEVEPIVQEGEPIEKEGEAIKKEGEAIEKEGEAIEKEGESVEKESELLVNIGDEVVPLKEDLMV